MADEVTRFLKEFKKLKNAGRRAFLWLECQDGQSFATLQVHPGRHEDLGGPHLRHPPQSSHHRRYCQEDPPLHRQKATPSRIRRRERRVLARADVKRAADKAASK